MSAEVAAEKIGEVDEDKLANIALISTRLSEDRAPAFYGEWMHGKSEAMEARRDASFVLGEVTKILRKPKRV